MFLSHVKVTRRAVYVLLNTEARSRRHFCNGKAINITNCECVFVALVIQREQLICQIVICVLPHSYIFPHYLIDGTIFEKEKLLNTKYVLISSAILVRNMSFSEEFR